MAGLLTTQNMSATASTSSAVVATKSNAVCACFASTICPHNSAPSTAAAASTSSAHTRSIHFIAFTSQEYIFRYSEGFTPTTLTKH